MACQPTPRLARWLPQGWEERPSPASFTYAAHQAFFAGFLPLEQWLGELARPLLSKPESTHVMPPRY